MHLCEIALYVFLECVSDAQGLSYYSDKRICQCLPLNRDQLRQAREALIAKQIILYDRPIYQVLDLPVAVYKAPRRPVPTSPPRVKSSSQDPMAISTVIHSLMEQLDHADT
jgi:hypothetical protein